MCGSKKQPAQVLPAQAVSAQPVSAAATVKTAIKDTDKERGSNPDLRSDGNIVDPTGGSTTVNIPDAGEVKLGAKKKRKGVVGLDL